MESDRSPLIGIVGNGSQVLGSDRLDDTGEGFESLEVFDIQLESSGFDVERLRQ